MTDAIADMIIRIKNAAMTGKETVLVPYSDLKFAIAEKLKDFGFVSEVSKRGKKVNRTIELTLARTGTGAFKVTGVKRVSKPGCRVYGGARDINAVRGGTGALVVSTPKGVLLGHEAVREKVGGEFLFEIW